MTELEDLTKMFDQIGEAEIQVAAQEALLLEAETAFKSLRSQLYKKKSNYSDQRRAYIMQCLIDYDRAMCANCMRLCSPNQMRTVARMDYVTKSDCSYSEWREPYRHEHPICMRCVADMTFSTHVEHGYTVGYELHEYSQLVHDRWIKWGSDNLEAAARALHIDIPTI